MKYIHISRSKFLHCFMKTGCIVFTIFLMAGCSAFQVRYETEVNEVVPTGYKYMYYEGKEIGATSYLSGYLLTRKFERIYHVTSENRSETLLIQIFEEDGIVFPPTFFHEFKPFFYIPKVIEFKIYDYETKKFFAVVKYQRGMFRDSSSDEMLDFYHEFKKIFINYKPLFDPYEGSY